MENLDALKSKYLSAVSNVADENALEELRVQAVGKKGEVSLKMRELGKMTPEERQVAGPALNALKDEINSALSAKKSALADAALDERLKTEWLDVSMAGRPRRAGSIHPISQVTEEIVAIFASLGFSVAEGPQIENDYYNFDALNIAPEHPARQEHDTFYMHRDENDDRAPHVLRTHTSPVQIRHLEKHGAPCRIICPGRVYRADYDQTHTPMFHQYEGMCIDKDISMANLKWTLEEFCRAFFQVDDIELRFRASHFPFTEPSAEVDIRCSWAGGQLKIGEGDDWMEILGSGMVHPKVLAAGGVDTDIYQGFAFGMGIDRLAMLKYGIPDLRAFFDSDLRWLRHYGFASLDAPNLHGGISR
jgi:phenylalanyl-tRNA synthetase alpha chain